MRARQPGGHVDGDSDAAAPDDRDLPESLQRAGEDRAGDGARPEEHHDERSQRLPPERGERRETRLHPRASGFRARTNALTNWLPAEADLGSPAQPAAPPL